MKRMFVFLLASLLLSCLCCIGFAAAPPQSRITAEVFYSFDDKDDAPFTIDNGNNGWFFYEAPETRYSYKDHGFVITDLFMGYMSMRIGITDDIREQYLTAEKCAQYDAIGFYIENNSCDAAGVSWFGEVVGSDGNAHQNAYQQTEFSDVDCYLMSTDGKIYKAEEYLEDYGHGLASIPSGFKGWYIVRLDSLGTDYCYYSSFGYHGSCDCGKWESGSTSILNPGVALYSISCEEGEGFVIDDYMLVKLGSNFTPDEGHATGGGSSDATASPAPDQTADTTQAPQTSDAPSDGSSFPVVPVVIAAAAAVAVIVVVIIIASKKKKKAE